MHSLVSFVTQTNAYMYMYRHTHTTPQQNTYYPTSAVEKCPPCGNAKAGGATGPGREFFLYPFLVRYPMFDVPILPPGATGRVGTLPIGVSLILVFFWVR